MDIFFKLKYYFELIRYSIIRNTNHKDYLMLYYKCEVRTYGKKLQI